MQKLFADTDISLDLLSKRLPFYNAASRLFTLADHGEIKIFVSSLSFSNLNYLLSRQFNVDQARRKLLNFKTLVTVLPVTEKTVELALSSEFKDFEDAIQYYSAKGQVGINAIITRNPKDFAVKDLAILSPDEALSYSAIQ